MIDISLFREAKRKASKASLAQVVSLIREVYQRRNPAKLGEVKDLVAKYKAPKKGDPSGCRWSKGDVQRRWLNTYSHPFLVGWTSINPSYDLGFTRYQGFDPSPVEDVEDFENLNSPSMKYEMIEMTLGNIWIILDTQLWSIPMMTTVLDVKLKIWYEQLPENHWESISHFWHFPHSRCCTWCCHVWESEAV